MEQQAALREEVKAGIQENLFLRAEIVDARNAHTRAVSEVVDSFALR